MHMISYIYIYIYNLAAEIMAQNVGYRTDEFTLTVVEDNDT
jgi:hypothetical protein